MKKHTSLIVVLLLLLVSYLIVAYFVFTDQLIVIKNNIVDMLILIPAIALLLFMTFALGKSFSSKLDGEENKKIKDKLNITNKLYESLSKNNTTVSKDLPLGILIFDDNHVVTFANDFSKKIFQTNTLIGKSLYYLQKDFKQIISKSLAIHEIQLYGKYYKVSTRFDTNTMYLFDITTEKYAIETHEANFPAVIVLRIDNMVSATEGMNSQEKTELLEKYYKVIENWKAEFDIYGASDASDKQTYLIKRTNLDKIVNDNFKILSDITEISVQEETNISLSIGVGIDSDTFITLGQYADRALNFASDRGGNQAVIYDGSMMNAYGGKSASQSERLDKATIRSESIKLNTEIKNSTAVIIMPHIDTDADALASSLGLLELCEALNTPAKILINKQRVDSVTNKIIEASYTEYIKLRNSIIEEDEVDQFFTGKTLLIVVDHHDVALSPSPKPYKKAESIVIIDHHRFTTMLTYNAKMQYVDPVASSTVELITEILSMLNVDVDIPPFIATAMLVGVWIDTNMLSAHVTDKTFEACAFLASHNADAFKCKLYLRQDKEEKAHRHQLIEKAESIKAVNGTVYVTIDDSSIVSKDSLAKTAEALLDSEGVIAGFALGVINKLGDIGISGRSNGELNICTEMEKFHGGGHFTMGAAQVGDKRKIIDVYNELIANIKQTLRGDTGSNMKVILIEDVKKKGKKGDIIDVAPGYANHLLQEKAAVEANAANIAALEEEKAAQEKHYQDELEVAKKIKTIIEDITIKIPVKTGSNGKFFGSITSKNIQEALMNDYHVDVDKRKIILPHEKIESLGTFECEIKLHKEVDAKLKIDVVVQKEN